MYCSIYVLFFSITVWLQFIPVQYITLPSTLHYFCSIYFLLSMHMLCSSFHSVCCFYTCYSVNLFSFFHMLAFFSLRLLFSPFPYFSICVIFYNILLCCFLVFLLAAKVEPWDLLC